jgi:ATP-dependent RNA helicase RhlE
MPDTVEAYTHRIGRTGRAAKTGDAFTFVTDEDQEMVRAIERALGGAVPRHRLPGFDYTAPAPARNTEFARPPRVAQPRRAKPVPVAPTAQPAPARRPASQPAPAPAPKRSRPTRATRPGNASGAPAQHARRQATG